MHREFDNNIMELYKKDLAKEYKVALLLYKNSPQYIKDCAAYGAPPLLNGLPIGKESLLTYFGEKEIVGGFISKGNTFKEAMLKYRKARACQCNSEEVEALYKKADTVFRFIDPDLWKELDKEFEKEEEMTCDR